MGGGSETKTVTQQIPSGAGPVIAPQYSQFATSVGDIANSAITGQQPSGPVNPYYNPASYQVPNATPVGQLTPIEQVSGARVADQALYGMPTPTGTAMAGNSYANFVSPDADPANSRAVQSAVRGLKSSIIPQIQNRYATMGLANAPTEIDAETGAMSSALVPMFMEAAKNQLTASQGLNTIGQQDVQNQQLALQNSMKFGELQRAIDNQTAQSQAADFLRLQNNALGYINPFGSLISASVPGGTTTQNQSGGSGWGWGK